MKKVFQYAMAAVILVFLGSCEREQFDTQVPEQALAQNDRGQFVPSQLLVKFKAVNRSGARRTSDALRQINGEILEVISTPAMKTVKVIQVGGEEELLLVSSPLGTLEAIARLQALPEIEYAEPNWIYHHFATSNDTYYTNGSLWGMYGAATSPSNQYGSAAASAWANNHTGSTTVYIGIIDEGYMYTHEDLAANAGKNPGEIAGNGVDDDGNGYKDDVYGWDFDGNNSSVFDGTTDDHGTHVAGTIGAAGANNKGVAGVCWNVRLLSAKFLGRRGGTTANAIKAIDYFTDLKTRHGLNLVATNNSWGGGGFSQGLQSAIERANQAGILFVAAAGNNGSNNDSSPSYPASYPNANIIAVASITNTGALSSFSQYGASSVDLGAPGSGIWSSIPKSSKGAILSGYASYSGTSMATPHVTGAAALYAAYNPGASAAQIKSAILNSTTATPSLSGKCVTGGRLNVGGF